MPTNEHIEVFNIKLCGSETCMCYEEDLNEVEDEMIKYKEALEKIAAFEECLFQADARMMSKIAKEALKD